MNIVFQIDDNYVPYLSVAIISLLENNKNELIKIFIFDGGIKADNKRNLENMCKPYNCQLSFLEVNNLNAELEIYNLPKWRGSFTVYYKLFAADILDECDKLLILDADIAVTGDVKRLFELNIENTIAMVQEPIFSSYNKFLNNKKTDPYYSAGTILINADKWRKEGYKEKIIEYIAKEQQVLIFPEQDILCALFVDEIYKLAPKYNRMFKVERFSDALSLKICGINRNEFYSMDEIVDSVNNAIIYHFDDRLSGRPWDTDNTHPFTELFDYYLSKTPWKNIQKKQIKRSISFKVQQNLIEIFPYKMGCWIQLLLMKLDFKIRVERAKKKKSSF